MLKGLARFHSRSPRYILSPDEDTWIRLAGPHQTPWEEETEIKDISLSGLSFTAPSDLSPKLGEVIKIQFTPPNSKSIASYAVTTRIQKLSDQVNLIAVHYFKMDIQHRVALAHSLEERLTEQYKEKKEYSISKTQVLDLLAQKEFYLMVLMFLIWFTFIGIYFKMGSLQIVEKMGSLLNFDSY